ncbi:Efflux transporter outer membrane subunit [Rhodovastum atsumiense]|uniref:Efflux transporter outer membrane subunit n=1 Tax=Rhodovastum atsumiense TaxID=504468 RepID=A0A5M6IXR1_9PROT|nr:efflux transporter outer membrane subunit [Rhodovastum atsumiense]KAA5613123.1 efflux transporter outer membrane subunit [Rhodovastum atsumiense]CAH2600004.1 Efflux transporter outer membrane subunit [Rhodovastum atsumiense]
MTLPSPPGLRAVLPVLAVVPLLAACTLGPAYQRPDAAQPVAWQADAPAGAPVWPAADWWKGFRSAELDALIAQAQTANFDIAAATARIRQADAALRIAGAPLLPSVSATGQETWNRVALSRRTGSSSLGGISKSTYYETRNYELSLSASYEIDLWGRLRATRDAALGTALASRFDQQTVALTAVTGVANAWFQVLALQDRLDIAERNLRDAETTLRAIEGRASVGTASLLDVSQQQALVAGLRAQVPALRSQLTQQLNGLGILTGQLPEAITARPGTLNTLALPEVAPGLPSELLARRPDIANAEAQLMAANADIRVARAAFFPQVPLTLSGGWQVYSVNALFGPGSLFAQAAIGATQQIFNNGQLSAQLEQQKARYDELVATYRKAVVQAFTDVENALAAYRYTTEQERLERDAVTTAQRAADIARAQLLAGTSDIVQVLQAQTTLFNNLDLLAQVRLTRFQALVDLYKALGGGWTRDATAPPETKLFQGVL